VRSRDDLVRLVRTTGGTVVLDAAGTAPGRGAYVCRDEVCLERARRRLAGALRAERIDFAVIEAGFAAAIGTGVTQSDE
jgi:predicted RNA-binding protein YlxR (DUF448 family)